MSRRRAWGVALCLAMIGCGEAATASRPAADLRRATTTAPATVPADVSAFDAPRDYQTLAPPVAVDIPTIGVSSPIDQLARNPDGTIQVPNWHRAGWWSGGPKPGQSGPAVILGHVDSRHGPDVFYRLRELVPGDQVVITRADGSQVQFTVDRVLSFPKDSFPTETVYAPSLEAGLRLVTCGGEFDRRSGHYVDNVIAFASVAGP